MILMINKTAHEISILYGNKARFSYECLVDMSGLSDFEISCVTYKVGDNHAHLLKHGEVAEFYIDDVPEIFVRTEKYEEQFINQSTGQALKHINNSKPVWTGVDMASGRDDTTIVIDPLIEEI